MPLHYFSIKYGNKQLYLNHYDDFMDFNEKLRYILNFDASLVTFKKFSYTRFVVQHHHVKQILKTIEYKKLRIKRLMDEFKRYEVYQIRDKLTDDQIDPKHIEKYDIDILESYKLSSGKKYYFLMNPPNI